MDLLPVKLAGAAAAGVLAVDVRTKACATLVASLAIGAAAVYRTPSAPHGQNGVTLPALSICYPSLRCGWVVSAHLSTSPWMLRLYLHPLSFERSGPGVQSLRVPCFKGLPC